MKIAIIGAGALGLVFGGLLSKENEVYLLDVSKEMVDSINLNGVNILDATTNIETTYYPKAFLNGSLNEKVDLIMVLVKSNYTEASLKSNLNIINKDTYVLTLQNGLGNDEKILPYVDKNHLILGVTRINSFRLSFNKAKRVNHGLTVFGGNDNNKEFVNDLVKTFESCDLNSSINDNIERLIWDKLFLNLSVNPYCAYYDMTMSKLLEHEEIWNKIKETLKEAVKVANALGQSFDEETIINTEYEFIKSVDGFPSMYQDIKAHRVTEIEAMNGKIAILGEKLGIKTPENKWITSKIHELENK